jgi:DivIVA domain-containing protein
VDRDSIDRIRSATFPVGRRGYEKREVDRFLNRLADWLETGGGDQTRAELVRRELERIGEHTGRILTDAHDLGQRLQAEAEREAQGILAEAEARAEGVRAAADEHAAQARAVAEQTIAEARAEAKRILDEANQRRADIEAVLSETERHPATPEPPRLAGI